MQPRVLLLQADASAALVKALADLLSTAILLTYEQVRSVTVKSRAQSLFCPQWSTAMLDTAVMLRICDRRSSRTMPLGSKCC